MEVQENQEIQGSKRIRDVEGSQDERREASPGPSQIRWRTKPTFLAPDLEKKKNEIKTDAETKPEKEK